MEKVTMKDIADALAISRVTVSKAFNNQAGVSDSLKDMIFDKARELGYVCATSFLFRLRALKSINCKVDLLVKCHLSKHKDLSSNLQPPCKVSSP